MKGFGCLHIIPLTPTSQNLSTVGNVFIVVTMQYGAISISDTFYFCACQLFQQQFEASAMQRFSSMFSIDRTTGRNVVFKIEFADASSQSKISEVKLESPSGEIFDNITYPPGENFGTIKLDMAEVSPIFFPVKYSVG